MNRIGGMDKARDARRLPRHVAIIMDGNGRWAKARGLPRSAGHRAGVDAVRRAVRAAEALGIEVLTLYAFSSENWSRPRKEVAFLFSLLRRFMHRNVAELHARNVRIRIIGERAGLEKDIVRLLDDCETLTAANTGLTLVFAFNYGGRQEIVAAARRLAEEVHAGRIRPEQIDSTLFSRYLHAPDLPDPDLVIRTSNEQRLSNFLLWQAAYAEFVFVEECWPDFTEETFRKALAEYAARERRFGGIADGANTASASS